MNELKLCVLDEKKACDDCGECNRCDVDPNKICDNCCRCIAMEDDGKEFRSMTIPLGRSSVGSTAKKLSKPKKAADKPKKPSEEPPLSDEKYSDPSDEPYELTPELVEYWENKLLEYGEAPADDGFGEMEITVRNPVYGKRLKRDRHGKDND